METIENIALLFEDNSLGEIDSYYRINTGFNNMVFSINDKYILKICYNPDRESNFLNEINSGLNYARGI